VADHFGLTDPLDVSRAIHLRQIPSARLLELAPVVLAASNRDRVAAGIIGRVADEVIAFATAALRRLELTGADAEVILGGRLLRAVPPAVIETIARGVNQTAPNARVLVAPSEPIVGAALLGLDALSVDADPRAHARAELDAAIAETGYDRAVAAGRLPEQSPSVTSE
jgi:hypothetical protein